MLSQPGKYRRCSKNITESGKLDNEDTPLPGGIQGTVIAEFIFATWLVTGIMAAIESNPGRCEPICNLVKILHHAVLAERMAGREAAL